MTSTAAQVEERCRQIRNGRPESSGIAQRAWERRAVTLFRDAARGVMRVSVELPIQRLYFERPDGRAIPRFGYRLADMRDDDIEPSAEVREERGVYVLGRLQFAGAGPTLRNTSEIGVSLPF